MRISAGMPEDFLLISGDDLLTKAIKSIGGSGIISVLANALPTTFQKISHGTDQEQLEASFSLLEISELMYLEGNPVGVKNLLKHIGICGDQVRLPMLKATKDLNDQIKATFDQI
jgi:4-hydroxy-tetrahydrodipicolinate synthase